MAAHRPYASSSFSQSSLRVGNDGTACQRSSSGTSATTAIVAACSASATSAPVIVAPTMTRRFVVDDDPRGARRAVADERAAGVAARLDVDVADVEARLLRPLEREADGPDLRIGEDDARRARPVRAQLDRRGRGSCRRRAAPWYLPMCVSSDAAVDVADRVEPVVAGHAKVVVDGERAVGLEPDRLEADARGPGTAAERREHLVRLERRAVVELDHHRARTAMTRTT